MKCQHHLMMVLIVSWSGGGFAAYEWNNNDMAIQHVAAFLHNNPHLKQLCLKDDGCPYKVCTFQHHPVTMSKGFMFIIKVL